MKIPKRIQDKIQYRIERLEEHDSPEGHFDHKDDVAWVYESLNNGNYWAWCTIRVVASIDGMDLEGDDYLGACSYASEQDFVDANDYYANMKDRAASDLYSKILAVKGA